MNEPDIKMAAPNPCGYWPKFSNRTSRIAFMEVSSDQKISEDEKRAFKFRMLEKGASSNMDGSINIPACVSCTTENFCRPLRINLEKFFLSPSQQYKVLQFQKNFEMVVKQPTYDADLFMLFKRYVQNRHGDTNSRMLRYSSDNFKELLNKQKWIVIFQDKESKLPVSFTLIDQHSEESSLEYVVYSKDIMQHSPGISSILRSASALKQSFPKGYLYIGSWSPGSPKLDYKKQLFHGLEIRSAEGWQDLARNAGAEHIPPPLPKEHFRL